jgi:hypothetical protein
MKSILVLLTFSLLAPTFANANSIPDQVTQINQALEKALSVKCQPPVENGADYTTNCQTANNTWTFIKTTLNYSHPAVDGVMVSVTGEAAIATDARQLLLDLGTIGLQYVQSVDSRASWDHQIQTNDVLFNDPHALTTFFDQPEQSLAAFVELSTTPRLIRIFIGFVG